jgi:hypothetical protein
MTAVNRQVANVLVHSFDTRQPRFVVRPRFHTLRIGREPMVIGKRDDRLNRGRGTQRSNVLAIIEDRAVGRHKTSLEPLGRTAEGNQAIGNLFGERSVRRASARDTIRKIGCFPCSPDNPDRTSTRP